jgi:hypothetical protein
MLVKRHRAICVGQHDAGDLHPKGSPNVEYVAETAAELWPNGQSAGVRLVKGAIANVLRSGARLWDDLRRGGIYHEQAKP